MIFIETDIQKNTDDIHALTRAFFNGEEVKITQCEMNSEKMFQPVIKRENSGKSGKLVYKSDEWDTFVIDVPTDEKDELKRIVYSALSKRTGKTLPWGSLTGIRPTRLVRRRIESGMPEDQIVYDMKRCYFTSEEKTDLSIEIVKKERELINNLIKYKEGYENGKNTDGINPEEYFYKNKSYSLYVDIPFCPTRCLYCSFTSNAIGRDRSQVLDYLKTLEEEIRSCAEIMDGRIPDTVYIGGGTPTALLPDELDRLLLSLRQNFGTDRSFEFTVEAGRPDSVTAEKLEIMKRYNVTRISVNPQTMNSKTLDLIGRRHTPEQVTEAYDLARKLGFDNINMDIIIGLPGEGVRDVEKTIGELCKLNPDSLTIHSLAVKRASLLRERMTDGVCREEGVYPGMDKVGSSGHGGSVPDGANGVTGLYGVSDMDAQLMMETACRGARSLGMTPYYLYRQKNMSGNLENTGYAKNGKHGLYNILINEEVQDILALGAGGVSKRVDRGGNTRRCANFKEVRDYISDPETQIRKKRELWNDFQ